MTWQDVLKIDVSEAKKLGEKYSKEDMIEARKDNPYYLKVMEKYNKIKHKDLTPVKNFAAGEIRDYLQGRGKNTRQNRIRELRNTHLELADTLISTALKLQEEYNE